MEELELKVNKELDKAEVESLAQESKKVTDEKIEKSLNYDLLSQQEKDEIEEFNKKINVEDATQILQYGAKAQTKISQFSDSVLEDVKTRSTGEVGDLLADLVGEIKSFDSDIANTNKTGLGKLFTSVKKQLEKLIAGYEKIEVKDLMKIMRIIEEKEEKDMSTIQERVRDWFNEAEARVNEMEAKLNKAEEKIKENEEKEEKAIKEAKKETLKDVIIRMLKIQLTYETIEQLTGASIEEIKEVRDELICQKI